MPRLYGRGGVDAVNAAKLQKLPQALPDAAAADASKARRFAPCAGRRSASLRLAQVLL